MDLSGYLCSYNVCGIYQVTHLLGGGSSGTSHSSFIDSMLLTGTLIGDVVRAFNTLTGEDVAIKLSRRSTHDSVVMTSVQYEISVYKLIPDGIPGFPSIHYSGQDANHNVIVMDILGPSLEALRRTCRGTFTLRTICMLADQMVWQPRSPSAFDRSLIR